MTGLSNPRPRKSDLVTEGERKTHKHVSKAHKHQCAANRFAVYKFPSIWILNSRFLHLGGAIVGMQDYARALHESETA